MNTQEKLLNGAGSLTLLLGIVLRIGHFVEVGTTTTVVVVGCMLAMLAYSRYSRRLATRVNELEAEVHQLRSAR